ncbi:signal recognition particle-docking protein FtsY [Reyranella massiliensis]|uniref:signal recognition particle-docking protein FtsY n=1 Tax=Reyranella massiliensis TaxID=445220 RepID=UPI0002E217FC|nr:signal recognition particle-docking protein FtsY [Reyranella massiliensis]
MSETEPEKKGWFARFRSRGTPAVETPKPAEPEIEKTEPVEPAVAAEPETQVAPSPSEPVRTAPQPETAPVEAVAEKEPEVEKPEVEKPEVEKEPEVEKKGWLSRLRDGLAKSTKRVTESITGLFTKKKLDQETLNELEDALIQADLGVTVAARLVEKLGKERFGKEVTDEEVRAAFADDIAEILQPVAVPLAIDAARKPHVVLVVGVNGSGKTTTIAKLASLYRGEGRSVMLAAGDTFRAAAVEQLKVWGDRAGVPVISKPTGADAAGLAYEALERARAEKTDVLLIDTAGRLHNKANLMEELAKIVRVIRKLDPDAPHSCLLVLDATTGQNAHAQVETFKTMSPVDALVLTKLDGSAKGGVLVALAEKFKLPVVAIGVGEGIDDLRPFEARAFARGLMGLPA